MLSLLVPGGACRYSPTCSQYTRSVILKYGLKKGLGLGIRRLLTCR
ncbi:MAG: membrane protein insertion efficiency factor YidD [Patescibacteria group bacterium]|nr:membrane protein insertion efficiency factor YidD [Patescibacteria group bacterium]